MGESITEADVRVRELEGLLQVKGVVRGEEPGAVEYREGEVRMKLDVLGLKWSPAASDTVQIVVPPVGCPASSTQRKAAPPQGCTSMPSCPAPR